jgi:predicted HAD superfamily hydrolase
LLSKTICDYKNEDWGSLKEDLKNIPWSVIFFNESSSDACHKFIDLLNITADNHINKKTIKLDKFKPWIDKSLLKDIKKKDKLYKKLKNKRSSPEWREFTKLKRKIKSKCKWAEKFI